MTEVWRQIAETLIAERGKPLYAGEAVDRAALLEMIVANSREPGRTRQDKRARVLIEWFCAHGRPEQTDSFRAMLRQAFPPAKVPPKTMRRSRGRPSNSALVGLVSDLASFYEDTTGARFKQYWIDGVPATGASRFVDAVVRQIDPELLPSLPRASAKVVSLRKGHFAKIEKF